MSSHDMANTNTPEVTTMRRALLFSICFLGADAVAQVPWLEKARDICAVRLGVSAGYLVDTYSAQGDLPNLGRTLYTHKFADIRTAELCSADLGEGGDAVDSAALIADEAVARWKRHGALKPEQYAAIAELPPETIVPAVVWLTRPDAAPDFRSDPAPFDTKKRFALQYTGPFADQLLTAFPYCKAAPVDAAFAVTARLRVADVLDVARWTGVADVTANDESALLAPAWLGTNRFDLAHKTSTGAASNVGIVEFGAWSSLPTLPNVTVLLDGQEPSPAGWHLQSVISVLSNSAGSDVEPGASPLAPVKYAGASSFQGIAFATAKTAVDLLVQNQVDAINMSFYTGIFAGPGAPPIHTANPEALGKYCDEQAYDLGVTFVAGAGNDARRGGSYEQVASPANGLNVIGVGMFNDNRTPGWEDDSVSPDSSWRNPPGVYGDRVKPDVVASGDPVRLVDASSGSGTGFLAGTSFATPMATGTVALINDVWRAKWGFTTPMPPELARAILAASALNNVDRVFSAKPGWPAHVHASEKDGSGGLDANAAVEIITNYHVLPTTNWGPCMPPQSRHLLAWFTLSQGQRARVAMAYSSEATSFGTPTADLDLLVAEIDPATRQVIRLAAWSAWVESNLEMVEFPVQNSGTYGIMLGTRACQKMPRYISFAWSHSP